MCVHVYVSVSVYVCVCEQKYSERHILKTSGQRCSSCCTSLSRHFCPRRHCVYGFFFFGCTYL